MIVKYIKIALFDEYGFTGSYIDRFDNIAVLQDMFSELDEDQWIQISRCDMTDDEYDALPEFDGF